MVDFAKLRKSSNLPKLVIDVQSCLEFVRLCAEEVDNAFPPPPDAPAVAYLRQVLTHVHERKDPATSAVISAIIDVYVGRGSAADKLADNLLSLHRLQFNGVKVDRQSLEKWAREARDYAEQAGVPDMGPINAYFVLLFR